MCWNSFGIHGSVLGHRTASGPQLGFCQKDRPQHVFFFKTNLVIKRVPRGTYEPQDLHTRWHQLLVFWRPHFLPRTSAFVGSEWFSWLANRVQCSSIFFPLGSLWSNGSITTLKLMAGGSSSCITQRTFLFQFTKPTPLQKADSRYFLHKMMVII